MAGTLECMHMHANACISKCMHSKMHAIITAMEFKLWESYLIKDNLYGLTHHTVPKYKKRNLDYWSTVVLAIGL